MLWIINRGILVRIPVGVQISDKNSQNSINMEEFLAGLLFEQKGILGKLPIKF